MIVKDSSNAQVVMLLASNDAARIDQLQRDLLASRIRYDFIVLLDRAGLTDAIVDRISAMAEGLPVVFVIDYRLVGSDCDVLLRTARSVPNAARIACVVINPPLQNALRQGLMASGARLFDDDDAFASEHLTLQ